MTEAEKKYIEEDLKILFPDDTLIYNDLRHYSNFTIAKQDGSNATTNFTIAFNKDIDKHTVEYMLIKKD